MKTKLIKLQFTSSGSIVTKTAILEIPDKLSDLIDDSNFVTDSELSAATIELNSRIDGMHNVFSPVASSSAIGGIKSQTAGTDGTNYPVEVDSSGNAKVNIKTNTFTVTENADGTVDLTIG